jgi:hypothetical protein
MGEEIFICSLGHDVWCVQNLPTTSLHFCTCAFACLELFLYQQQQVNNTASKAHNGNVDSAHADTVDMSGAGDLMEVRTNLDRIW